MADETKFQPDLVKQLAKVLNDTNLNEIEYEVEDHRIRVVRYNKETNVFAAAPQMIPAQQTAPVTTTVATPTPINEVTDWQNHPGAVKSPMVGNAYLAPEPGVAPYAQVGTEVKEGQTLLIIEAMKVMNPIKAPRAGRVTKVMITDSSPVEYDEVLLIIE